MRCQQVLSGAANNGNSTVVHCSFNGIGYTVYCTGCDIVVLDDVFHRVQLISNISGCRSLISAITLCPNTGLIGAVCTHSVYILSPQCTLNDDHYPFSWDLSHTLSIGSRVTCAAFNCDELIVCGTQILVYKTEQWTCTWSTHLTEETIELTVSPDGRFFTTLSQDSKILKLWKRLQDGKDYRSELIPHPAVIIGSCWRQISTELPKDAVRQVLLTSCHDCIGRIWLETPSVHPSITLRPAATKSFVLGTVLDPLKEATEKRVTGSPYIFQWFNNKAHSYSLCLENARLKGELISEQVSVDSYDIADQTDLLPDGEMEDGDVQVDSIGAEVFGLKECKVKDMAEYKHTASQLLKVWYKSFDMVVCISPATGSLMGWRVEKIDVAYSFQTLTTRFVLRLPWSLSYADARQLKPSFAVFSTRKVNTNSQKDKGVLRSRNSTGSQTTSIAELEGTLVDLKSINIPTMCLVSAHYDGTVNLFTFEMALDDVTFTDIGNLVHEVRCSGHRCAPLSSTSHPYIPLALTTSSETGSLSGPGYGELILWRLSCIGPMTTRKTGVLELARVDTKRAADFTAVSWFPKAFSVTPDDAKDHAGILTSFVLHFVAFTGHSLELYRVITLSECLHTAKMILNKSCSMSGDFVGEDQLRSKSSGSGASKIYHIGRLSDVTGDSITSKFLHTFPLSAVQAEDSCKISVGRLEEYYVVLVDSLNYTHTVKVSVGEEEEVGQIIQEPKKVQAIHSSFFSVCWDEVLVRPLPLPRSVSVLQCSPAAATVATPKFLPHGTTSPYLFSALCSDNHIRFFCIKNTHWGPWPRGSDLELSGNLNRSYICNSIPGRLAVAEMKDAGLFVSIFESESSGGACWTLEDSLKLECTAKSGPVLMDFMSSANGTQLLAIVQQDLMWVLTPCSCISLHTDSSATLSHPAEGPIERWVSQLRVQLNTNGLANPRSLSWNSTGSLLLGINTELQLFSPWYSRDEVQVVNTHSHEGVGNVFNDALSHQPRLPQYHPYVLRQLIDNRKVSKVKLILHCLLRYLASYYRSSKVRPHGASNTIAIIPPLPLHELNNLAPSLHEESESVIDDAAHGDYSALLNTTSNLDDSDDEQSFFSDEEEHNVIHRRSICHSESGLDSSFVFDSKRANQLDELLSLLELPGLTRGEQLALSCLALTVGTTNQTFSENMHAQPAGQDLDDCGLRFTLELRYQSSISKRSAKVPLQPNDCIWAFHSSCQTQLIDLIPGFKEKNLLWEELKSVGAGWWVKSTVALKNLIEIVCKTKFQVTKNPLDCALFYLAMKKKTLLQSLYRTVKDLKMATFLKHDFTEARWKTAAKKNAFVLLGQQRYEHAAAFFLLADSLEDALELLLKYSKDIQLALVIARLYEEPQSVGETNQEYDVCFKRILCSYILGRPFDSSEAVQSGALRTLRYDDDPFICSMAHWWLQEYQSSLYCLLRPVVITCHTQSKHILSRVFSFYCYLYRHPLLRRCKDPITIPFETPESIKQGAAGAIDIERRMIFITAYMQYNMGCPTLSLDVLGHLEQGFTQMPADETMDNEAVDMDASQISTGMLSSEISSVATLPNTAMEGFKEETAVDLSNTSWMTAPSSRFDLDEEYELDLSSSASETSSSTPPVSLNLKLEVEVEPSSLDTEVNNEQITTSQQGDGEIDPFMVQFQLKCCVKILADELRSLPHALLAQFDPELGPFGGRAKPRARMVSGQDPTKTSANFNLPVMLPGSNQLGLKVCLWLKNEIETVAKMCSLKYSDIELIDLDETVDCDYMLLKEAEHFTYELENSILTVLLLFCILHGDLDYNLAALRLELLFLLQEFQSKKSMSALIESLEAGTSSVDLPPLLTNTAPPPLLLSPLNMLWQLTGHTLKLINRCSVSHHTTQPEIKVLNSLSMSASACMWQCLALRHGTTQMPSSYAIVKHQPLSWPGLSGNTVFFLVSAGKAFLVNKDKEGALPIAIVLVEAIVSVYLGLFLYSLSNSNAGMINQLLHNVPSADMWTKVTGTTVQSVDNSPIFPKKQVSMMGERIRVKGPSLSKESLVTVRETFLPPSMSLVEFFRKDLTIDYSNMFEVDSDCEETLDDEGDDPEDFYCYSWHIMRLLSITLVQEKIAAFLSDIGLNSFELAGMSPLLANTLKTLMNWKETLHDQLDAVYPNGAPPDLLPTINIGYSLTQSLTDPACSPFSRNTQESLQARILWHTLATKTPLVEYLKLKETETVVDKACDARVRTVFSGTEGVSSFSCSQNTLSTMLVTTIRETLEIDVKLYLDRDKVLKEDGSEEGNNAAFVIISNEENKAKTNLITQEQQYGSENSSINADVSNQELKRTEGGVRCSEAHRDLNIYLTGHTDGFVKLWEFGYPHHLTKYALTGARGRVTSVHFGPLGAKFGLSDTNGVIGLWHTTVGEVNPYCVLNCHDRAARDFAFLGSTSVIASVGNSSNNKNVVIWDTLLPTSERAIKKFQAHEMGAMVCCYSPRKQLLLTGGAKGDVCIFDIRQRKLQHVFNAHDSAIRSMCLGLDEEMYFTGSAEGEIKSWSFDGGAGDQHSFCFSDTHKSHKLFSNLPGGSLKGVMKLQVVSTNHLISCGADGDVKMRLLTNL